MHISSVYEKLSSSLQSYLLAPFCREELLEKPSAPLLPWAAQLSHCVGASVGILLLWKTIQALWLAALAPLIYS
jgi:hypothetical protein